MGAGAPEHESRLETQDQSGESPILSLRHVSKIYSGDGRAVHALDDVSLDLQPKTLSALVGRSGCGKSTLLNLAGAMDTPTSGEVVLAGASTTSLDDAGLTRMRREVVGFVFQSFQLMPTLTVVENVELPLLLARRDHARRSAEEMLAWVELEELAHRYPHQLSGGEMQRCAIARALVHGPRLLLADEPTGNLDTATGNVILSILARITELNGAAVLMATHSAEAANLAGTVYSMRDGRIERVLERHGVR
jgi:ABC-type lipoprotein export system ATPase subunit